MGGEGFRVVDTYADGAHAFRSDKRPRLGWSLQNHPHVRTAERSVVEAVGFRDAFKVAVRKGNAFDVGKRDDGFHRYAALQPHGMTAVRRVPEDAESSQLVPSVFL